MKTFSQNQMMLKLLKQNKRQKNQRRNKEKQKVNVVNNKKKNQRKMKSLLKKIVRKIRNQEIDYSKKKVRKEVLDNLRYNYLKSVRKYMNNQKNN